MHRGGRRHFRARERAGTGACRYCGRVAKLTWDHAVPRAIAGENRDDPRNLVRSCWPCNTGRKSGQLPSFDQLPKETKAFVLSELGAARAGRYFHDVPEAA